MEQKSPDAFRTISEVAEWLGVPTHVLRFWESRFTQVKPVKRAGGRRYYRPSDMELLGGIRKLLHEDGMTIRGVQKLLREEGVKHVAAMSPSLDLDADGDEASNVVSLSEHARSSEAEIEDAEVMEDDETTLAVDEAIEDGAVAPIDPEEDRPVSFGTDDTAGPAAVDTDAPTLSDETSYDEVTAAPEADETAAEDTDENVFADPLETAQPVDEVPDEALADDTQGAGEDLTDAAVTTEADDEPALEMVTSGALPEDDAEWALASNEPFADDTAPADDEPDTPTDEASDDTPPEWDPAIEVSGADDSDIAAPLDTTPTHTEEPSISRAAPTADEDSGGYDEPEQAEPAETASFETDISEEEPVEEEPENFWSAPDAVEDTESAEPEPELEPEPTAFAADDPSDEAEDPAPMPVDAGYSDYAPVLVMPDIDDDPADGTLPPDIAPIGPRLRRLRALGLNLPPAHLSALSDRLKTLGGEPNDGVLR